MRNQTDPIYKHDAILLEEELFDEFKEHYDKSLDALMKEKAKQKNTANDVKLLAIYEHDAILREDELFDEFKKHYNKFLEITTKEKAKQGKYDITLNDVKLAFCGAFIKMKSRME